MAGLTPYTTTEAVRGALGVSAIEIPDARMVDRSLDVEVLLWLQKFGVDHELVKATADANPNDATAQADYKRLCLGTMYATAAIAAESPIQFMVSIGDGKNQAKRFDGVDWADLARSLRVKAQDLLAGISTYVAPAGTTLSLMGRATPTYDPVTNT